MTDHSERDASIVLDYQSGLNHRQIAPKHDLRFQRISQILREQGVDTRPAGRPAPAISPAKRAVAIKMYRDSRSLGEIAEVLGRKSSAINKILRGWGEPTRKNKVPPCGAPSKYLYHRCRCEVCIAANTKRCKVQRHARVARGKCHHCRNPPAPGHTLCEVALSRLRKQWKTTMLKRRA